MHALEGRRCNWRVGQQKWPRPGDSWAREDAASAAESDASAPVLRLKQAHDRLIKVQLARWHDTLRATIQFRLLYSQADIFLSQLVVTSWFNFLLERKI